MKTQRARPPRFFAVLLISTLSSAFAGTAADNATTADLPYAVRYELGNTKFAPGDNITIQQVRGTSETIAIGGTYSVEGTYTLGSRDEADLAFYSTSISASGPTPVDPKQHTRIKKGTGSFRLVKTMNEDGYLHVSVYPVPSGSSFGGVYFGQGDRVLRDRGFRYRDENINRGSSEKPVSLSGPNQALLDYLGNPVAPPANMDARYTRQGLIDAIQLAARNAGITPKKVAIDDSEYPFLVGVICGGSDFAKLKGEINKLDGYHYNGSVGNDANANGSDTCNAFSIVPYQAHPRDAMQDIAHRLMLRQQVFYDKLSTQE
jgi:hypothetical protein